MNFKSTCLLKHPWPMAVMALAMGAVIISCNKDDDPPIPTIPMVQFSNTTLSIEENTTNALTVNLTLSGTLEKGGTITVSRESGSTTTDDDYSTNPAAVSGTITLNLSAGATSASFTVTPIDNSDLNDDKTIIFRLSSADGGIALAASDLTTTVTIVNNDVIPATITTSVTSLEDLGTVDNGNISDSKSYIVSGTGLTSDIAVSVSDNFEVSLENVNFSNSVDIPFAYANSGPVNVFVRFIPSTGTDQEVTGTITHFSSGASDVKVTVSGTESGNAAGGLLFNDNFDYGTSPGNLTALSAWENYSGTISPIQYMVEGLSMAGYESSGIGGSIAVENGDGSREDVVRSITSQNSGTVYTAQLINVNSATASELGDFFLALRDNDGKYFDRLYAKDDGSGDLLLGTARTRSSEGLAVYASSTYSYNTTYLVVIKYNFSTKVTSMFVIEGSLPATEPVTPDVVANTGLEPVSFEDIIIRQSADDIAVTIDGIRIANTWNDALGL